MKHLSKTISTEVWLQVNYAIARFMRTGIAFKTKQNQPVIFTAKIVRENDEIGDQLQLHLRLEGRDYFLGYEDELDIDIYVPKSELSKLLQLKAGME